MRKNASSGPELELARSGNARFAPDLAQIWLIENTIKAYLKMSLVYVDSDPWLAEHDACEKLLREIKEQLTIRSKEHRTSQEYARVSSSIRLRMKQYESEIQQLKEKLAQIAASYTITFQEAERRSRQVEHLESQKIQLQKVFIDRDAASGMLRANLMQRPGPVFADMGTTGWGTDEPEDDRTQSEQHMSVNELRQHQQRMVREVGPLDYYSQVQMNHSIRGWSEVDPLDYYSQVQMNHSYQRMARDQNEGLEILSKVISRQKEIAQTIGNEVDIQNEIIEDLADHMDRTDSRLLDETKQIKIIDKKDRTCWYWVTIILLFITIVIVGVV
uniref:t-SNARE coiled-coil homology domain-containing protein n=1 Tax=Timema cristinae TaxID=61476 RepID=A0A7R9H4P2_TIMCR|nr:unnamed protein product [Timema cristinae]